MRALVFLPVCLLMSCGTKPPPPAEVIPRPTMVHVSGDVCEAAQANLLKLQCQDEGRLLGGPTKRGMTFDKFCKSQVELGVFVYLDILCLASVTDCRQVDAACMWGK